MNCRMPPGGTNNRSSDTVRSADSSGIDNTRPMSNDDGRSAIERAAAFATSVGRNDRYVSHPFPLKLHDMLNYCIENKLEDIVSWQPSGLAFAVHDNDQFAKTVIHKFFRQSRFKSFQRQLHVYGFKRIRKGFDKGAYHHPMFVRGQRDLARHMLRQTVAAAAAAAAAAATAEKDGKAPSLSDDADGTSRNQLPNLNVLFQGDNGIAPPSSMSNNDDDDDMHLSMEVIMLSLPTEELYSDLLQPVDPQSIFGDDE